MRTRPRIIIGIVAFVAIAVAIAARLDVYLILDGTPGHAAEKIWDADMRWGRVSKTDYQRIFYSRD